MDFDVFIQRKYFLFLILKILIFLALGYKMDFFKDINGSTYNNIISYLPYPNDRHKDITLVDVSGSSPDDLRKLIDTVSSYRPELLLADIFHRSVDVDEMLLHSVLETNKTVIFTLPVLHVDRQNIEYPLSYEKHMEFFKNNSHSFGFYSLKKLYTQEPYQNTPSETSQSLISLLHPDTARDTQWAKKYTNYNGNPPFAKVYADDIMEGNVISDFFEDKIVLISNFDNTYAISPFSELFGIEFLHQNHMALMVNSAISNDWFHEFSLWQYFLFLIVFTTFWVFLVYKVNNRYTLVLLILSFFIPLSAYWLCIAYVNFLLPLSEMIFIAITTTFLLFKHWQNLKSKDENSLLINIAKRLQEKVVHKTFFNSDEYWEDLTTLINQLFNLKKNILFEKVEGDTRIKEIVSFNCTFSDIKEMRRDYTREPFTSAINSNKVTAPSRKFFQDTEVNEKEFIVPLIYHNTVIGFWAFTLDYDEMQEVSNFEVIVDSCAKEISELIYQRNQFIAQKNTKGQKIERVLSMEISDEHTNVLKRSLAIIEKRMLLTETIFDNIHSNVIIYNLFGKIIQLNQGMNALLEEEGIASYTFTAGDMLATLTDLNATEAKELIRDVTFTQRKHIQFVHLKKKKKRYLLTISSIAKDEIADKFSENYLFNTFGIVFELVDLSFVEKNYKLKQRVIEKSQEYNKNRLYNFEDAIEAFFTDESDLTHLEHMSKHLKSIVYDIVFSHNRLNTLIEQNLDTNNELFPLDIQKSINDVSSIINTRFKEKQIRFNLTADEKLPLVLASVNGFETHLYNLLNFLVDDCEENGTINIILKENKEFIEVLLKSNGYGIPQEQLDSYLSSASAPLSYKMLVQAREDVESWFGNIIYSCRLGEGIVIKLSLLKVDL